MRVPKNKITQAVFALAGLVLVAGCSKSLLTAPDPAATSVAVVEQGAAQAPQPPSLLGGALPIVDQLLSWVTVVTKLVRKDQVMVVTGHRWSLQFEKGSLSADATITISDYDPNVLDVQFGPHGTQFPVPVTLSIDLSNTDADPSVPRYNGCEPQLYWLNDESKGKQNTLAFLDRSLKPDVKMSINELGGHITGLSSEDLSRADIQLHAKVGKNAPMDVKGKINLLGRDDFTDVKVNVPVAAAKFGEPNVAVRR